MKFVVERDSLVDAVNWVSKSISNRPITAALLGIVIDATDEIVLSGSDLETAAKAKFKAEKGDNSDLSKIDSKLQNLSIGSLQSYRNIFRRDRDYSIMYFILAWGVNVVDATVSGQLKEFDVSDNLSFRMVPYVQPQQQQTGLSLQFHFKNTHSK